MPQLIWLNGEIIPMSDARIGVEDRGFQFADGIYEVIRVYNGRPFTLPEHLERLDRSAAGISLPMPLPLEKLSTEITRFLSTTGLKEGMIYLQLTRGICERNHIFPDACRPTLLFYIRDLPPVAAPGQGDGVKLLTVPDERWRKCWIKSVALLANVLAKNQAIAAGADEALFVEDGWLSECSASNFHIISNGTLHTHPVGPKVLPGITRLVLLDLARKLNIPVLERPISEAIAFSADEAFITSTTREIAWVQKINHRPIASGACGPLTTKLHQALVHRRNHECGIPA